MMFENYFHLNVSIILSFYPFSCGWLEFGPSVSGGGRFAHLKTQQLFP